MLKVPRIPYFHVANHSSLAAVHAGNSSLIASKMEIPDWAAFYVHAPWQFQLSPPEGETKAQPLGKDKHIQSLEVCFEGVVCFGES